ncbi:MAG: hypothetical protein HY741_29195 [Chloroflexi bacterium]|nr:hypothetical protein [Chloroflexota bacterium]
MSTLADYTQDEIEKMMAAPMLVSMYVMGTALSGPVGLVKEMMAGVETAIKTAQDAAPDSVLHTLFAEDTIKLQQDKLQQETKESTQGAQNMEEAKAKMLDDLKTAVGFIAAKGSPAEAAAYRQLMVTVAENVAHAAKEGGFMGIGGVLVNDAEKQALDEISAAVNAPAAAAPPASDAAAPAATA